MILETTSVFTITYDYDQRVQVLATNYKESEEKFERVYGEGVNWIMKIERSDCDLIGELK
jgi:hypothetical protein